MNETKQAPAGNSLFFLGICGAIMLAGIMLLAWMGTAPANPLIGRQMPELHFEPLIPEKTEPSQTASGTSGTVQHIVLHLWGPWCPPCRQEFPEFIELYEKFKGNPQVQFVCVAFPSGEMVLDDLRRDVQDFFDEKGASIPTFYDAKGKTSMDLAVMMPYGSLGFPTTIVADKNRQIVQVLDGFVPGRMLKLEETLGRDQ